MTEHLTQHLTLRTVVEEWVARRLLPPEASAQIAETLTHPSEDPPTPWFVSALIGVGAWLSVIPFIAFLVVIKLIDSPAAAIVAGLILIIGTVFWHRFKRNGLFLNQLALALNFTGQILFIVGIAFEKNEATTVALATWFLEIVLISVYRDNILRFIAVLIAMVATLVLLNEFEIPQGVHILIVLLAVGAAWYWIAEARHLTDNMMKTLYQPLGYGFVVALQTVLLLSILPDMKEIPPVTWWYSTLGLTVLLLALEYYIMHTNNVIVLSPRNYAIFGGTLLIALLLYQSPGIMAAVIVLLLGFQRGNRVLMGLALVFLTVFLIAFYYHLNITLLMKSIALMGAGLALLILRFMLKYVFPQHEGGA